jgi:hypothetical protein
MRFGGYVSGVIEGRDIKFNGLEVKVIEQIRLLLSMLYLWMKDFKLLPIGVEPDIPEATMVE